MYNTHPCCTKYLHKVKNTKRTIICSCKFIRNNKPVAIRHKISIQSARHFLLLYQAFVTKLSNKCCRKKSTIYIMIYSCFYIQTMWVDQTTGNQQITSRSSISLILSHHKTDINFKAWNLILFKIKIDMIKCVTSDKRNKIFLSMEIE